MDGCVGGGGIRLTISHLLNEPFVWLLVIFDNLSTLCTDGSESASEARVPMQNWLLKLRRQGIAVLLVNHAGTNGRQRGTSRREDALDTVIALRRPEDLLA